MAVDFAKVKTPLVALCVAFLALAPRAGAQCDAQRITLKPGWNAVYVEVSPEGSAADIFASWPVDSVGVYDPADYLVGFEELSGTQLLRIGGKTRGEPPSRLPFYTDGTVTDGEALLVGATDISDWSGALFVSPMTGLDFGTDAMRATLPASLPRGEAAWNPEGTKTGTCRWTFSNLMRQGDITLSGPMTVKRVSPLSELVRE